jgi:hypothetical protein
MSRGRHYGRGTTNDRFHEPVEMTEAFWRPTSERLFKANSAPRRGRYWSDRQWNHVISTWNRIKDDLRRCLPNERSDVRINSDEPSSTTTTRTPGVGSEVAPPGGALTPAQPSLFVSGANVQPPRHVSND